MTSARAALGGLALCATALLLAGCTVEASVPASTAPASTVTPLPSPSPSPSVDTRTATVMIGDSLMSGYGLDSSQAWPTVLSAALPLQVTNLACGGTGFVAVGDCGTDYSGFVPAVAALAPQLIIVESSSNDFDLSNEQIVDATRDTLEQLRAAAPDAVIVGLSTIWNDDAEIPPDVEITSAALAEAVTEVGGTFLDVGQPLAGHPEWMQFDDVHPTSSGQRAIAAAVREALLAYDVLDDSGEVDAAAATLG